MVLVFVLISLKGHCETIFCQWQLAENLKNHVSSTTVRLDMYSCCRYNNRTYRIDDIAWDVNPQCTFTSHDGSVIRFMDYYK